MIFDNICLKCNISKQLLVDKHIPFPFVRVHVPVKLTMSAILPVHDDGLVYFFSMATSFTKAALGAEGIGKDVTMIIGNGYTKNHAQITLDVLRENPKLRKLFDEKYC